MSLADQLKAATVKDTRCKYARVLDNLDDTDREQVHAAVLDGISLTSLARILSANGHHISTKAISPHIAGTCTCPA